MFGLGPATKIYIAIEGVDMRKGFDGLFGLVRDRLGQDPLSGHLFLFSNQSRSRLKVLVWDGSGLWVCAKRLEKGRFRWPAAQDGECVVMRPEELAMLINGLDLAEARPRKNWLRGVRLHKTFFLVYVRKRLAITRRLTYNRTYSRGSLRPTIPHRISATRISVGASENTGAHRRVATVSGETVGAAQRDAERSAIGTAGRPGAGHDAGRSRGGG